MLVLKTLTTSWKMKRFDMEEDPSKLSERLWSSFIKRATPLIQELAEMEGCGVETREDLLVEMEELVEECVRIEEGRRGLIWHP